MGLRFPGMWRFAPPTDGQFINRAIPDRAISDFVDVIDKVASHAPTRWPIIEHFKNCFGMASRSTSESWAYSDLRSAMDAAASNAPLFIECFFNGCENLRAGAEGYFAPDAVLINRVLRSHNIGYEVRPPNLDALEQGGTAIAVEVPHESFAEKALEVIYQSLKRSDELLAEGRPREAVQESLWLLETVATAFRGVETESGKIEGKYFNQIVRDLRARHPGTTLDRVLGWISSMHGYLSSPTGGGVRHGTDLHRGVVLDANEARLFCNLARSYVQFLLAEHQESTRTAG